MNSLVGCQSCFADRRQVHFMDQLLSFALNTLGHFYPDILTKRSIRCGGLKTPSCVAKGAIF
ncbi:MAG: hypothetical protein JO151_02135 [Verrucomicrobia bacterium]|nr:hypothetical protein [Verrucomicrobiota bacterium]